MSETQRLRALADTLRKEAAEKNREKTAQCAAVLTAATGLLRLKNKVFHG